MNKCSSWAPRLLTASLASELDRAGTDEATGGVVDGMCFAVVA